MRKLLLFHVTGDDGYYESAGQAFDWPVVDEEFNQFSVQQLEQADTLVLGRVTCQLVLVLDGTTSRFPGRSPNLRISPVRVGTAGRCSPAAAHRCR